MYRPFCQLLSFDVNCSKTIATAPPEAKPMALFFGSLALSQVQLARLVGHWLVLHCHNRPWLVVLDILQLD